MLEAYLELALVQVEKQGKEGLCFLSIAKPMSAGLKEGRDLGGGVEWQGMWQDMIFLGKGIRKPLHRQ